MAAASATGDGSGTLSKVQLPPAVSSLLVSTRKSFDELDLHTIPLPVFLASSAAVAVLLLLALARRSLGRRAAAVAVGSEKGSSLPRGTRKVLLVGPMGVGKTTLFAKALYGSSPETLTSSVTSSGLVRSAISPSDEKSDGFIESILPKPVLLLDIPGHPRLRARELARALPSADGVVFLLDATKAWTMRGAQEAGEHLHLLLSLLYHATLISPSSQPPPVLILLTKTSLLPPTLTPSAALSRTRTAILRELNSRRTSNSSSVRQVSRLESLDAVAPTSSSSGLLGGLLNAVGLGRKRVTVAGPGWGGRSLPEDEAELIPGEVLEFEGEWEWEKAGAPGGVEWATTGGEFGDEKQGNEARHDSLDAFWDWTAGL